ncbi:hypothetical protein EON65_25200 [archaeon]|nr:MAG: hypothetical protein EON65_25200 [archaeon]
MKDLIKKCKSSSADPNSEHSVGYLGAFLDVLRVNYGNYLLVNQTVQEELEALIKSKPRGFGGAATILLNRKM